jgi:hypothetical protein
MLRVALAIVLMATVAAWSGCGKSSRIAVKGNVLMNGQPLESGDISFAPISPGGGPTAGAEIKRGSFHISAVQGLLPGDYKVQIHAFRSTGKKTWDGMGEPNAPANQKHYVEEMEQYIPAQYNDATELKATIAAGKTNAVDFDLTISPASKGK